MPFFKTNTYTILRLEKKNNLCVTSFFFLKSMTECKILQMHFPTPFFAHNLPIFSRKKILHNNVVALILHINFNLNNVTQPSRIEVSARLNVCFVILVWNIHLPFHVPPFVIVYVASNTFTHTKTSSVSCFEAMQQHITCITH